MTWKDVLRKITSRKFLLALASVISGLFIIFNGDSEKAELISGIILTGGATIAYIFGEAYIDGQKTDDIIEIPEGETEEKADFPEE